MKLKLESRLLGEISITSDRQMTPYADKTVGLKLNIQKTKIMASGPITSWQIDGETMETVPDFNFGGSKFTADGDCSHEIKRCLLFRRKAMREEPRWQRSRTGRTLSPPQIHQKSI